MDPRLGDVAGDGEKVLTLGTLQSLLEPSHLTPFPGPALAYGPRLVRVGHQGCFVRELGVRGRLFQGDMGGLGAHARLCLEDSFLCGPCATPERMGGVGGGRERGVGGGGKGGAGNVGALAPGMRRGAAEPREVGALTWRLHHPHPLPHYGSPRAPLRRPHHWGRVRCPGLAPCPRQHRDLRWRRTLLRPHASPGEAPGARQRERPGGG